MAHVFHQLYYHFTWTTKERKPLISEERKSDLLRLIEAESRKRGAIVLACNTMPDHVHLFVTLPPTVLVATFIGQVKGASAFSCNRDYPDDSRLAWQNGYSTITVRKAEEPKVTKYIENQPEVHANRKAFSQLEPNND